MQREILTEKDFNKLKEKIKKLNDKEIIFTSGDDELNRKVLEKLKINILLIPLSKRKDYTKQRNSGLNEVMAKIAKEKKIQIGIDLDELITSKNKSLLLSRLKQNITLCNRYKVQMQFIQSKNKRDKNLLKSLGLTLGMPTWMIKNLN